MSHFLNFKCLKEPMQILFRIMGQNMGSQFRRRRQVYRFPNSRQHQYGTDQDTLNAQPKYSRIGAIPTTEDCIPKQPPPDWRFPAFLQNWQKSPDGFAPAVSTYHDGKAHPVNRCWPALSPPAAFQIALVHRPGRTDKGDLQVKSTQSSNQSQLVFTRAEVPDTNDPLTFIPRRRFLYRQCFLIDDIGDHDHP